MSIPTGRRRIERTLDESLTRKMRRRGHLEYDPIDVGRARERLEKFLLSVLDEQFEVHDVSRLTGGASMEQFAAPA